MSPVAWEAVPGKRTNSHELDDPDYYVAYNEVTHGKDATRADLLNLLLASYQRGLSAVPSIGPWGGGQLTDQQICERIRDARAGIDVEIKRALLSRLMQEEPGRATDPAVDQNDLTLRDRYRVCQAIWATNANDLEGRRPRVEDSTIVIPTPRGSP
jgi:hypothetical protein